MLDWENRVFKFLFQFVARARGGDDLRIAFPE
jgi:hypothetical protein